MIFIGHKIFLFLKKLFIGCIGSWGFPDSSVGKESTCNAGDPGSIPGSGRSLEEGKGYPLQYCGLENSMDSPWGCKESDRTERLSLLLYCPKCLFICVVLFVVPCRLQEVSNSVTPWSVQSMEFSRPEYWSG